jgi:hypothetical protein
MIARLTPDIIAQTQLTAEEAWWWAWAYEDVANDQKVDNVTAGPRAQLMRFIAKMLDQGLHVGPEVCCQEELAWRHPAHPFRVPLRR